MSGGRYRDLEAVSNNGLYRLTATSNDKGPNRTWFPSSFTYRMSGASDWNCLSRPEVPYPLEIQVSDDGFSVLHLHSAGRRPHLAVFDPQGHELLNLAIGPAEAHPDWEGPIWETQDLRWTTAGIFCTPGSWQYFLSYRSETYFVFRARSGQRLVLRLAPGMAERIEADHELTLACEAQEVATALQLAAKANRRSSSFEKTLWRALIVLWRYLLLHRLGRDGLDPYEFQVADHRLVVTRPTDREQLLHGLSAPMTASEILGLVGSPDAISRSGDHSEVWEYDQSGSQCIRLLWNLDNPSTVQSIQPVAIDWPQREALLHSYAH